jgi:transposase
MDHIQGIDRNQISIFALEEMVAKDSWARLIDVFVDALPLDDLGFKGVETAGEGRPPYHPGDLLKLYMYGYKHGLRSTRKLEHAARVNLELWWLLKGLKPSNRAIAYIRKNNPGAFKNAFRYFVLVLKDWDLIDGNVIAIDSFKIRAQNSLKNNFHQKKIHRQVRYIDEKIAEYEKQPDEEDEEDERQKLINKIDHQKNKKQEYSQLGQMLKDSGQAQLSLTDPDAKAVVMHRNIVNVGYNIQAVSDQKNKLLVHADTGSVNDTHVLAPIALDSKELLAKDSIKAIADKGYNTGEQLQICKDNDITTYVSPKQSNTQHLDCFQTNQFTYNAESDTYTCRANEILDTNGSYYKKGNYRMKQYKTRACSSCTIKKQCTRNKTGRLIERSEYQEVIGENRDRVLADPDYYRTRQQIIEHQFGTMERQWGFTHTLMKGKEYVLSEVHLLFMIYNLRRSASILGLEELKKRLKALITLIFQRIWAIRLFLSHSLASFRLAI